MRLGKVKPTLGAGSTGPSKSILCQSGRAKEHNVLCLEEVDPFWGEGHLPTPGVKANE